MMTFHDVHMSFSKHCMHHKWARRDSIHVLILILILIPQTGHQEPKQVTVFQFYPDFFFNSKRSIQLYRIST